MEIASPYLFRIKPHGSESVTHAGVLEFIADEGNVHLPAWMMRQLGLSEGDPIHLTGTTLPKGKFVKIQPQTTDFLEISDPKAVLEQAFRNFSCLTKGDIVEISYNCLTFEILIMETVPDAEGILIIDTDLEVDFAPPKGYVEPAPKPRPPPPTMASKLKIDNKKVDSIPPSRNSTPSGTATPAGLAEDGSSSAAAGSSSASTVASGPFRGQGQSLSGKKSKGKKERAIESLDPFSMIRRTDRPTIVTNDTQFEEKKVPAALNLPFGKLYFGYDYVPLGGDQASATAEKENAGGDQKHIVFSGAGQTLSGRAPRRRPGAPTPAEDSAMSRSPSTSEARQGEAGPSGSAAPFGGQGQTLGSTRAAGGGLRSNRKRERAQKPSSSAGTRREAIVIDDDDDDDER